MVVESPTKPSLVAVSGIVGGRVQGVFFRYSMQRAATGLGLAGWVKNLPDGSVAFHAEGKEDRVEALLEWSQSGPALAHVDSVEVAACEVAHLDSFEIYGSGS